LVGPEQRWRSPFRRKRSLSPRKRARERMSCNRSFSVVWSDAEKPILFAARLAEHTTNASAKHAQPLKVPLLACRSHSVPADDPRKKRRNEFVLMSVAPIRLSIPLSRTLLFWRMLAIVRLPGTAVAALLDRSHSFCPRLRDTWASESAIEPRCVAGIAHCAQEMWP